MEHPAAIIQAEGHRGVLEDKVLHLESLAPSITLLARGGYAFVGLLLVASLLVQLPGAAIGPIRTVFSLSTTTAPTVDVIVPLPAVALGVITFILGWSLALAGFAHFRHLLYIPMAALFLLCLLLIDATGDLAALGSLVVLAVGLASHVYHRRRRRLHQAAFLIELVAWAGSLVVLFVLVFLQHTDLGRLAASLGKGFALLAVLAIPFWGLLSLDVVEGAVALGRLAVTTMDRLIPARWVRWCVFGFLVIRPGLSLWIVVAGALPFLVLDLALSLALLPVALVLGLMRRWSAQAAHLLTGLSLASLSVSLALNLAFINRADPLQYFLLQIGIFPPVLLFVGLMAFNILGLGAKFANGEGLGMPRPGRVLAYLGVSILVVGFTLFFSSARTLDGRRYEEFDVFINGTFALGLLFLGIPYLALTIWRQRRLLAAGRLATAR